MEAEACGKSPRHAKKCSREVEVKDRSKNAKDGVEAEQKEVEKCIAAVVVKDTRLQGGMCIS